MNYSDSGATLSSHSTSSNLPSHQIESHPTLPELSDSSLSSDESVVDSDFERGCNFSYPDADIASTHANNEELSRRDSVKRFFSDLENHDTFTDEGTRDWFGRLPGTMFGEALPLFTDSNTKDDYQVHLAFTGMKVLHTYDYQSASAGPDDEEPIVPDNCVHSLLWVSKDDEDNFKLIPEPYFVIPLGRLFVNRNGQSEWTGHEVFISNRLEVWILLALDQCELDEWQPVKCSLCSELFVTSDSQSSTTTKYQSFTVAKIATSIKDLRSDGFLKAMRLLESSKIYPNGFIRLLEIMPGVIPRALGAPGKRVYKILETEKLRLNEDSEAGWTLMKLAIKKYKKPIFRLEFCNQPLERSNDALSLWDLASERNDKCLKYLDKYDIDLHPPSIEQITERPGMDLRPAKEADQKQTSQQQPKVWRTLVRATK